MSNLLEKDIENAFVAQAHQFGIEVLGQQVERGGEQIAFKEGLQMNYEQRTIHGHTVEVFYSGRLYWSIPPAQIPNMTDKDIVRIARYIANNHDQLETHLRKTELPVAPDAEATDKIPGYIYLAYCDTGHYKIGMSKGPKDRIKVFNVQMPVEVTLEHTFEADDMPAAESRLHAYYANFRVEGEWFELTDDQVAFIKSIEAYQDGEFI